METNFQRVGSISNTHVGREFEEAACVFFRQTGISLQRGFVAPVGFKVKKDHKFDLGSETPPVLVECKSYTWTTGGNSPSAKIRGLNEVMLLFSVSPDRYRKILFVLKHLRKNVSGRIEAVLYPYQSDNADADFGDVFFIWEQIVNRI